MTIVGYLANNFRQVGYLLFENATDTGQYNIYDAFDTDLSPYITAFNSTSTLGYGIVKYYAIVRIDDFEPRYVKSFEGYPARYKFGQFQWLQGASRCVGPRQYIDAVEWSEDKTREMFILPGVAPAGSFPPGSPDSPIEFNRLQFLAEYNTGANKDYQGGVWADGFSFYLERSVSASIAILYRNESVSLTITPGGTTYLVNI